MHLPGMTKLGEWMKRVGRDDQWLADALGCSRTQACRVRNGSSRPSPPRAFEIERLTKGAVKAADLLTQDTTPQADAA